MTHVPKEAIPSPDCTECKLGSVLLVLVLGNTWPCIKSTGILVSHMN